jgi:hypothetical protein
MRTPARVSEVAERGPYLEAMIDAGGRPLRFFFERDEGCRELIVEEAGMDYVDAGPFGELRRGETKCVPAGIGTLEYWRSRTPRAPGAPAPRSHSSYRVIYRDEDVALLRGRFLLAARITWRGGDDTIAVVPSSAECSAILERDTASLEFRDSGPEPFRLIVDRSVCPVIGFVRPLPELPR